MCRYFQLMRRHKGPLFSASSIWLIGRTESAKYAAYGSTGLLYGRVSSKTQPVFDARWKRELVVPVVPSERSNATGDERHCPRSDSSSEAERSAIEIIGPQTLIPSVQTIFQQIRFKARTGIDHMTSQNTIFGFELDFAGTLYCIPMCVRLKLDACGVKVSLKQWNCLPNDIRRQLVDMSCDTTEQVERYRSELVNALERHTGLAVELVAVPISPEWKNGHKVPQRIIDYALGLEMSPPSEEQWARLDRLQRFSLFKLTRPNHDNDNFLPAMREFGLAH